MQLLRAQLRHVGPLADHSFRFADDADRPRAMTCVLGGAGTGKTSLLAALASTRPGHAIALPKSGLARGREPAWAVSEWLAGDDDSARPHPLLVATPGAALDGERDERVQERRREQVLFERKASEGGFAFASLAACRWFSQSPVSISLPERMLGRYDVHAPTSFDDASRNDLARETKQVLSSAAVGAALAARAERPLPVTKLDDALRFAVSEVVGLAGYSYRGADPISFEPAFETSRGEPVSFDDLPTAARHLASFAAIPLRALHAAYGGADPLGCEGVVVIDDVELHQDPQAQRELCSALRRAIPRVQWIVTTSSSLVALGCEPEEVIALRRMNASGAVELHTGSLALVH